MKKSIIFLMLITVFSVQLSNRIWAEETSEWYASTSSMYTYKEMECDLVSLRDDFDKDVLYIEKKGNTFDQRCIYHIIVGNPKASKHILITGAIHGREYITAQLVMRQLIDLCNNYQDNISYKGVPYAELLEDVAIHFVPMINPDGVTISQLGIEGLNHRYARQNVYQIYIKDNVVEILPYLKQWKANARGVDINRNFDALWKEYQNGTSHPSSSHYKGEMPHNEVESKALVDITEEYNFIYTVSYHTQGQVIYWYFGQEGECLEKSKHLIELISKITGYATYANYESLDPAGYKDWALEKKSIPSITIEVGTGNNPVNPEQLPTIWEQNKEIVPELLMDVR